MEAPSVVADTTCDWVKPIYLSDHDIDVMDCQTKNAILCITKRGRRLPKTKRKLTVVGINFQKELM